MWRRALRPAVADVGSDADLGVVFRAAANLFWCWEPSVRRDPGLTSLDHNPLHPVPAQRILLVLKTSIHAQQDIETPLSTPEQLTSCPTSLRPARY